MSAQELLISKILSLLNIMKLEKYSNGIIFLQQIKDQLFQSGQRREMFFFIYMDTRVKKSKYLLPKQMLKNKMYLCLGLQQNF